MTLRNRHVRVSVRPRTEAVDAEWRVPDESFAHARYQRLLSMAPVSGEAALRAAREGHYAEWIATARSRPAIPEAALLVTFDAAGNPDLWLKVVKAQPRGLRTTLLLREIYEVQS